ncbi:DMT family transporter [Nakamurella alba]|uniref:DMT family transporter n=1 Tax=Nakamurella alba TaxID=2665158 RepID=UPI003898ECEC
MEATFRWILVTAVAPIAWGSNYYVTHHFLPAGHPLWGAALRALPAGLLLWAIRPRRPHGSWWWKSLVLGVLNVGAFFTLIYLASQLLPTSIASSVMATSPVAMMLLAWGLAGERPRLRQVCGALVGIVGVALLLLSGATGVGITGVLASVAAMLMSSVGYILAKRWRDDTDVLVSTSWQLLAGGLVLVPVAVLVEGGPPSTDAAGILAFGYVAVVAGALAFLCWFTGLRRLPAATVGLVGLLNPVTGVLLGVLLAGETLGVRQLLGLGLVLGGILVGSVTLARRPAPGVPAPAGDEDEGPDDEHSDPPLPRGLHLGVGHRVVPDRGRRRRGRPRTVHLGHVLAHAGQGARRRHR